MRNFTNIKKKDAATIKTINWKHIITIKVTTNSEAFPSGYLKTFQRLQRQLYFKRNQFSRYSTFYKHTRTHTLLCLNTSLL